MYSYAVIPIIALFCYMFLLISFLAAKKDNSIWAFMGLLMLMVAWTAGSLFMRLEYWPSMEFWFHVSLAGLLLLPVALFWFLRAFTGEEKLYGIPFWAAVIVMVVLVNGKTGIFLRPPVRVERGAGAAYVYEITWAVLVLFAIEACALAGSVWMLYENKRKNVFLWSRLTPIWVGIGFLVAGHICILIPAFKGFPIDVFAGIPMAACLYYALYKKRVFELKLLVSKANCYTVAFFFAMVLFYRLIPDYEQILRRGLGFGETQSTMLVTFSVVFASWILYIPLRNFLDSVFESDEVKYSKCIGAFGGKVSQLMSVGEVLDLMAESIKSVVPVEAAYIFLVNDQGDYELSRKGNGLDTEGIRTVIPKKDHMMKVLKDSGGRLLMRDYKLTSSFYQLSEEERLRLTKNRIECVTAIQDEEQYLGLILLAAKTNGENYGVEELDFLASIGAVASIAVKNSLLYEAAYQEARRDYLTGVANRKYFYEMIQKCCESGQFDYGTLLMVNVDDFKLYNQLYGAEAGDDALKRIAELICGEVPEGCFVARHSGKEFAVLFPGYPVEAVKAVAERISESIRCMNRGSGEYAMKVLTVSCGIALGVCPMPDYHEVVNHVEMAVYYAKQAGKNRIVVYTEGETPDGAAAVGGQAGLYSEYASTIYALTAAIDAKDHYTFSHSENVAYYARELARAYGMNEEGINIVFQAGMLHDIGKIGIEERILNKPGKLTKEEYEIMKTHVELSIGIIRHLPSLDYVIPAVIGHHERYDGKGYPRRMKGEEVPLMARILCVADSFDAMVSRRSYKPKMEVDRALEILQKEAGTQFDPKLVPVFVRIVRDGTVKIR